jgi:hypothetical protein
LGIAARETLGVDLAFKTGMLSVTTAGSSVRVDIAVLFLGDPNDSVRVGGRLGIESEAGVFVEEDNKMEEVEELDKEVYGRV